MVGRKLGGMMTIMETPLTDDGELDLEGLRRHTSHTIEGGAKALITTGGNGEFYAFSEEERKKVLEVVVDEANGRVPVVASTSHTATREVVKLSRHAQDVGAEGLMICPPYYGYLTSLPDWAIYKHYEIIASAVDIQIMLYSQKYICDSFTPWTINANVAIRLIENFDNITCMKETWDILKVRLLSERFGDRFSVFCGNDPLVFAFLGAGAKGATVGLSCIAPKQEAEFFDAWERGDITKAHQIWNRLLPLIDAIEADPPGEPTLIKVAMRELGIISSAKMRSVWWDGPIEERQIEKIRKSLRDLGLLK